MRFTIRDLFWAMLVVAVCGGWFCHVQLKDRQRDHLHAVQLRNQAKLLDWYQRSYQVLSEKLERYEPIGDQPPENSN